LTEPQLQEFFNTTMRTRGMVAAGADDPILSSWIAPEQNYAFVEFGTVESANQALSLNGLTLGQNSLRISRPNNYQPTVGVNELIDPAALQGGVLAQTGKHHTRNVSVSNVPDTHTHDAPFIVSSYF